MAYQSLYRKYRPQRFAELVGQAHVHAALLHALRDDRVGHAYLFSGPRGTGKTTTARLLAKALNCTNRGADGDPCGACESCVAIAEGTSLDVIEVDAASRSKVDEMRDLLDRVAYLSAGGGKKVYILDEVHMLSGSAEAALLKTLEEAPEHVVFVLATTDPLKVAPTIRSRTQHYEFTLYSVDELQTHLANVCAQEGVEASPEALAIVARAGAGSMRDSLSLLDQAIAHGALDVEQVGEIFGGTAFERRIEILGAVADEDVAGALVTLGELLTAGHEPRRLTEDLLATTRDTFHLTAAKGRVKVEAPEDDVTRLAELGEKMGPGLLVRALETQEIDSARLTALIETAKKLGSDFELRTVLERVAPRSGDPAVAAAYLAAARQLGSDFERRTALVALLEQAKLDDSALGGALDAAAELGSDFEKRTVLEILAKSVAASPDLHRRYRDVARGMSDFERGQALRALDDATSL